LAVIGGLVGTIAGTAEASDINGFVEPAGSGVMALSFTTEGYDEFWAGTNKVSDPGLGRVSTNSTTLFTQYGLTDRVTLVANLPYVNTRGDGIAGFAERGLQDLAALVKVRLVSAGRSVRSSVVLAGGIRTIASNYEGNKPVSIGDGTADGLIRAVYMLRAGRFYWSQQVGLDLRGGEAPDGFPIYTELGVGIGPGALSAMYKGYLADGGTDIGDPGFTFPSNKDEYHRVGVKGYLRLSGGWGATAMVFTTLSGRNSADATGFSAGIVVRY
jgi:hypothetical protein